MEQAISESDAASDEIVLDGADDEEPGIEVQAPRVGFFKRWTRRIAGWVKRLFTWGR